VTTGRFTQYIARDVAGRLVDTFGARSFFAVLTLLFRLHQGAFIQGQAIATLSAMTVDSAINNLLTYRARQWLGSRWWRSCSLTSLSFCGVEGLPNVGMLSFT
jgi:hypothetical protein